MLTIKGEKKQEREEKEENYMFIERVMGVLPSPLTETDPFVLKRNDPQNAQVIS